VPLMAVIVLLASRKSVMGAYASGRSMIALGWLATGVMGLAAIFMFL